jgi:RNA polymerase sigma-70 factor (ECF subfamily)
VESGFSRDKRCVPGGRLSEGDGCMTLSQTGSFSDEVRAWLAECLPRAVAYARSLVRDTNEADDVVQECVYRLLKRAASYDLPRDGSRLLFRAVTNECINRATRARPWISLDAADQEGCSLGRTIGDARAEQPMEIALTEELRALLDAALERLPVTHRAALELKSLGYSLEEIAEALSITANHAGVLVHRARQAVRERIAAYVG